METDGTNNNQIIDFVRQVEFDYKRGLISKKEFEYIKATLER